ncbi:TadE/TadG family type IV pilus assembly protein [Streptomyces sp. HNM0663]|uniref:TadE/TadG family type IV pilus assembly protein n=1 Tax=Streptomyces chengmaiensis TaxID=3040919 RepID=A0ABT6HYW4_9ACTN|nr:TadE/TadG family type IV pilus assembly protein [Streptomyces chengmaiensis]MDH2393541.1 TadE/TadG family type IV pilus assembly protein [Streptomyces chengmaiensis]
MRRRNRGRSRDRGRNCGRAPGRDPEPRRAHRPDGGDRGQAVIEYGGWLVLLLFVAMAAVQVGLAVYAAQQAGTAARAAARVASQKEADTGYETAGRAAMSSWLDAGFALSGGADEVTVRATVTVPSVVPGLFSLRTSKSATMPRD